VYPPQVRPRRRNETCTTERSSWQTPTYVSRGVQERLPGLRGRTPSSSCWHGAEVYGNPTEASGISISEADVTSDDNGAYHDSSDDGGNNLPMTPPLCRDFLTTAATTAIILTDGGENRRLSQLARCVIANAPPSSSFLTLAFALLHLLVPVQHPRTEQCEVAFASRSSWT
jgi:hypothetical protein